MSKITAITSVENGKLGGRPKGAKARHTLEAERGKARLVEMYLKNIEPIMNALIGKAKEGDIQAIKELHDRVYGKASQPITGAEGGAIQFVVTNYGDTDTSTS